MIVQHSVFNISGYLNIINNTTMVPWDVIRASFESLNYIFPETAAI